MAEIVGVSSGGRRGGRPVDPVDIPRVVGVPPGVGEGAPRNVPPGGRPAGGPGGDRADGASSRHSH